jgi:CRISPR type IV-associated protein Csf3
VKLITQVQAWCVGDPDELWALLDPNAGFVTSIGPRKRSGHGSISTFDIVEDDAALNSWGQRALPWEHDGAISMDIAVHPPYWAPEHRKTNFINPALFF